MGSAYSRLRMLMSSAIWLSSSVGGPYSSSVSDDSVSEGGALPILKVRVLWVLVVLWNTVGVEFVGWC